MNVNQISNHEFVVIMTVLCIIISISFSYHLFIYLIYNKRRLSYYLFESRDKLIMSVASGSISKDDPIFNLFYNSCNELINSVHSDFFSFNNFIKRVKKLEEDSNIKERSDLLKTEIQLKGAEFQKSVNFYINSLQKIMLERNKTLIFLLFISFIIKNFGLYKIISSSKLRHYFSEKANYKEYRLLDQLKYT